MANWLQGWDMNRHGSTGSSGLVAPTEKQVTDAGMLYALYMAPMTRLGQSVAGALVRAGAKRIVPPSGLSLSKRALSMTPAGSIVQMGKGTVYRYLDHSNRDRTIISQSSERSSPSYQQSGSSGGTSKSKDVVKPRVPQTTIKAMGMGRVSKRACPPGYRLVRRKGRFICLRNDLTIVGSKLR
jgi:hypothetical protein